jgi:hypothetical protein
MNDNDININVNYINVKKINTNISDNVINKRNK